MTASIHYCVTDLQVTVYVNIIRKRDSGIYIRGKCFN